MDNILSRRILAIALPAVVANITTPLLGLVDTSVTGHLDSDVYLAAIAVGTSIFNLLYFPFAFLRMGTSGMTAQALGRGDMRACSDNLYRGIGAALLASLLIIALQRPVLDVMLRFMSTDAATSRCIARYFSIVVWGAPAVLTTYVITGWLLGMQSSRKPMVISIIINVVNIAVSPLLAFAAGMKMDGVAAGTLAAQWVGAVVGVAVCLGYRLRRPGRSIVGVSDLKRFFSINADIFLRTLCLVAVTIWFTRAGARQGELTLSANALMMQLFILFSYLTDGFAYAGEAICGHLAGERRAGELRRCVRLLLRWGLAMAAAFSTVYFVAGGQILRLLTDRGDILAAARDYLPWIATVPLAGFLAFTWDGIYIGLTATRYMLASMAASMALFFALYFTLIAPLGNHALWLAFVAYLLSRGLLQSLLWPRILHRFSQEL